MYRLALLALVALNACTLVVGQCSEELINSDPAVSECAQEMVNFHMTDIYDYGNYGDYGTAQALFCEILDDGVFCIREIYGEDCEEYLKDRFTDEEIQAQVSGLGFNLLECQVATDIANSKK